MPLDDADRVQLDKYGGLLKQALATARKLMRAINAVHAAADEQVPYPNVEADSLDLGGASPAAPRYGPTQFFGQGLAPVVRRLISDSNGGLDIDTLFSLMKSGGYGFKEGNDERAKANLKISLGKYTQFDRTPNGYYVISDRPQRKSARQGEQGDQGAACGDDAAEPDAHGPANSNTPGPEAGDVREG